jgi:hypothetical protein
VGGVRVVREVRAVREVSGKDAGSHRRGNLCPAFILGSAAGLEPLSREAVLTDTPPDLGSFAFRAETCVVFSLDQICLEISWSGIEAVSESWDVYEHRPGCKGSRRSLRRY